MLKQITIKNFTLISEATIDFYSGFTAITGETGAGKSVLLKSLRAVCGDKTPASVVRTGADKAIVEAEFKVKDNENVKKILENLGIDFEDELVLRREIPQSGNGRARVNGVQVKLADLQDLGEELLQMHGQSEQLMLRDVRTHASMLDAFAENAETLSKYSAAYSEWTNAKRSIEETKERAERLAQEKDFFKFQFEELKEAALKPGEEEELEEKTSSAAKGETERRFLDELKGMLDGETGLLDQMNVFEAKLRQLASKIPSYNDWHVQLKDAMDPFDSILREIARIRPEAAMSEAELNKANSRLAKIQRLKRKYKTDVDGLIALRDKREEELASLENLDSDLAELEKALRAAKSRLDGIAAELSARREAAAARLDVAVETELHKLGMPAAHFHTAIAKTEPSPNGADHVEFLLAPNQGEGERSLQKAVSGGELSRVLLAFKTVTAATDKVPLLIFDEVDSGISGEIGNKIGDALRMLGTSHQVLTITHLHQVASRAKNQLAVKKEEIEGRTYTRIANLDYDGRVTELVRMLGESNNEQAREHAKQLLENNND